MSTAQELHAYMTFRAAREKVGHTLSVAFYRKGLDKGCTSFFGVQVKRGKLTADHQQPRLFAEWNAKQVMQ